ncbi:MAG TPA: hypothetical protein VHP83_16045 [Aggregatilineaceae bacterium]|nr:hypothetical protein [Aggregatilineaceae bacterium]
MRIHRFWLATLVISSLLVVALGLPVKSVDAAGENVTFGAQISAGCDSGGSRFEVQFTGLTAGDTYYAHTIASVVGAIYMDEFFSSTSLTNTSWGIFDVNSGGTQNAAWPLPSGLEVLVEFWLLDAGQNPLVYTSFSFECSGEGLTFGSDMVNIPSGSVVGLVTADTPIYSAPNMGAASTTVLTAGKTIWLFGLDSTGAFYKGMLAGRTFWVPAGVMAPNPDKVWNSTPLPGNTIQ